MQLVKFQILARNADNKRMVFINVADTASQSGVLHTVRAKYSSVYFQMISGAFQFVNSQFGGLKYPLCTLKNNPKDSKGDKAMTPQTFQVHCIHASWIQDQSLAS